MPKIIFKPLIDWLLGNHKREPKPNKAHKHGLCFKIPKKGDKSC